MFSRRVAILCLTAAVCSAGLPALADGPKRQTLVKAAFLYNFGLFVQWPDGTFESTDSPLVIGVVAGNADDDGFCDALTQLVAGKSADGHPIVVKKLSGADDLSVCQILYLPASTDRRLGELLASVAGKPVLTVGETDELLPRGGIIRFFSEDNKVRFEINPDAAQRSRLRISSKLLKLARIYKP